MKTLIASLLSVAIPLTVLCFISCAPAEAVEEETLYPLRIINEFELPDPIESEQIVPKQFEVSYESEYDRIVAMIYEAAEIEELPGDLMVAIWRLETGNGTSKAFMNYHNFFGATGKDGLYQYPTESEGLKSFTKAIHWYVSNGMDTPEKMQPVFCPANPDWAILIREIMEELK